MSIEIKVSGMQDITTALQAIAKRLRISVSALVEAGGVTNGSLTSVGTGRSHNKDMAINPLLRVLGPAGFELVGRGRDPHGLIVKVDGGIDILVRGADGGRLEVIIETMADIPVLLNTMAAANNLTMTGLVRLTGANSTSLVGIAKGTGGSDLRLLNLVRLAEKAQFELVIRARHATRREARLALTSQRYAEPRSAVPAG